MEADARFHGPAGLATDGHGNLLVLDSRRLNQSKRGKPAPSGWRTSSHGANVLPSAIAWGAAPHFSGATGGLAP